MWNAETAQEREQCRLEGAVVEAAKTLCRLDRARSAGEIGSILAMGAWAQLNRAVEALEKAERGEWE